MKKYQGKQYIAWVKFTKVAPFRPLEWNPNLFNCCDNPQTHDSEIKIFKENDSAILVNMNMIRKIEHHVLRNWLLLLQMRTMAQSDYAGEMTYGVIE